MSTIALFGGSGRTGMRLLERLLKDGHDVRLLSRREVEPRDRLTVIIGDATDADAIAETVKSADVVMSALGTDKQDVLSRFTPLIISAMQAAGITRILTVGTAGILQAHDSDNYRFETRESKRSMTTAAEDHAWAYELLDASTLDYTIVCPTQLIEDASVGNIVIAADVLGTQNSGPISRDDVADLVIQAWENNSYRRHRVGITTES
ncbi:MULTISPECIES: NAD(P)-dependent oxidoreductase [unclassified Exiguobacterium]|uniref:NAD(P)-dependent oxidoreductase n=1 Tax=unclassified Exiguobacterium TaxID=2644629 RepID=UPI001BE7CE75|nr:MULTISPECIES: NAD(P)H-binding protein [unclassified Exiguobacterium]